MKNIVLTGFMGTGKTVVGRAVAQQLGRKFVDMDAEIEARAGKSIPRIFTEDGEAAFRRMERALCRELSEQQELVIATGGGALIDPVNREMMMKSGIVICLAASGDEIIRRLNRMDLSARPLLSVADPHEQVARLLETRREVYSVFPWQIDTTGLAIDEVVQRVAAIAAEVSLPVRYPGGSYEIRIGVGFLDYLGELLREKVESGSRVAVVTNEVVASFYAARAGKSLQDAGFSPFFCVFPDGEGHKTLTTVKSLYSCFLANGLDRGGLVVSLGGGVTGDIAGFTAATFMRGVKFIQVPTSLLAMVDASVGGKTGVNLPQGKNLVGVFKFPELVIIDPTVLSTLPPAEIENGVAEAIKHGIIGDAGLFALLERGSVQFTAGLIARALRVKIKIVEDDPYERGYRRVLNLGHTVGHALERESGFSLSHGRAVAIGLAAAARIAAQLSRADYELVGRIEAALAVWGLPFRIPEVPPEKVIAAMAHDKKRLNGRLRFILPREIGNVEIVDGVPPAVIRAALDEMKGE